MDGKERTKLGEILKEGEIIAQSPSFKTDFRIWKKKACIFIKKNADEKTKEKAKKITEKDALYIYLWETDMDDLEKQAVIHYKWQLEGLMTLLRIMVDR